MAITDEIKSKETKQAYEEFLSDFAKLREDINTLKKDFSELTKQSASDAKSALKEGANTAEAQTREAVESAADELQEMQRQAERAIRKKPLSALAGAAAIGYFIATLRR